MVLVFIEHDLFTELAGLAIDPHPDKTLLAQPLKNLLVLPLFLGDQGCQEDDLFPLLPAEQRLQHVVHRLGTNRLVALRAIGLTGTGEQ